MSITDEIVLRRATIADAGEALTLERAAFVQEGQLYHDPFVPPLVETLDEVRAAIGDRIVLVAWLGPRAVATGRVRIAVWIGHIGRLAVAPDLQGQGIGRRLLAALEAACGDLVDDFELFTGQRTEGNLHLYRTAGYREVRREHVSGELTFIHLRKEAAGGPAPTETPRAAASDLVGTWRLRRWEAVGEDGSRTHPLGERVEGILVYTAAGTMITVIGPADRPRLSSPDPLRGGPVEERLGAAETFIAYAGSYRVEGEDVVHTVVMSLYPNWVGTRQVRHLALPDQRTLVLMTDPFLVDGRRAVQRLTWTRDEPPGGARVGPIGT